MQKLGAKDEKAWSDSDAKRASSSCAGSGVDLSEKAPQPHGGSYLKKDFIGKYFLSEKIRIHHGDTKAWSR